MGISTEELNSKLNAFGINVIAVREDLKSSEKYVDLVITQDDGFKWEGSIPYYYRRTGLFIQDIEDLVKYLKKVKVYFTKENIKKFQRKEKKYWKDNIKNSDVTIHFFYELIKMKWTTTFPQNDNPQRRIQAIKEMGYTIASKRVGRKAARLILPIPKGAETGYEYMSVKFKKKAISVLESINVYELSKANKHGLLPDHKFPEIRWDKETKAENSDEMPDEKIKGKFQLVDNQRNQQKREVCRKCFQTGERGKLYGINFFYVGNEKWDVDIPKIGKEAEKGCIGCGWYDIQKWRESLNELVENNK